MSSTLISIACMTLAELVGNTNLKFFTTSGKHHHLVFGIIAYMAVIFFLLKCLKAESLMWTCLMWEAMIIIGGALTAYFVFGEKFTHWIQYFGILLTLAAVFCVNYSK